jgi:hypothetical protein
MRQLCPKHKTVKPLIDAQKVASVPLPENGNPGAMHVSRMLTGLERSCRTILPDDPPMDSALPDGHTYCQGDWNDRPRVIC